MRADDILIFDFDGVLIDSAIEICISAYNTAADVFHTSPGMLPDGFQDLFLLSKGSARNGGEMVLLAREVMRRIESGEKQVVPRTIIARQAQGKKEELLGMRDSFIVKRRQLIDSSLSAWKELHKPIEQIWNIFLRLQPEQRYILTYKDRWSVLTLSEHFGAKLNPDLIYSSDTRKSKYQNFFTLLNEHKADRYHFIDDSPFNLLEIHERLNGRGDVRLLFASWGYGKEESEVLSGVDTILPVTSEEFQSYSERICA